MALFESYERRIDKINEVLNSYGIASLEEATATVSLLWKRQRRSQRMPDWTFTIRSKAFSRSALRMHAGLTSQAQRSQSRKTAEMLLMQQLQSERDFRHSVFRDLLLISVK